MHVSVNLAANTAMQRCQCSHSQQRLRQGVQFCSTSTSGSFSSVQATGSTCLFLYTAPTLPPHRPTHFPASPLRRFVGKAEPAIVVALYFHTSTMTNLHTNANSACMPAFTLPSHFAHTAVHCLCTAFLPHHFCTGLSARQSQPSW